MKTLRAWQAVFFLAAPILARAETPISSSIATAESTSVNISWMAVPGKSYALKTSRSLASEWEVLATQPVRLTATTNRLSYTVPIEDQVRFYRVVKLDTEPPQVLQLNPPAQAIAVSRRAKVEVQLWDESEIDASSIIFTVGNFAPMTLGDPRLHYGGGVLTFTLNSNEFLGDYFATVPLRLSVSDTLGNRLNDFAWSLGLELETILSDNVVFVNSGPAIGPLSKHNLPSNLTLISRADTLSFVTLTFRYSGDRHGLSQGQILIDTNLYTGFTRTVLSVTDMPWKHEVVVLTEQTPLAKCFMQGSCSSSSQFVDLTDQLRPQWQVGSTFSLSRSNRFDGVVLYANESNTMKVDVLRGHLDLNGSLYIGGNFAGARLTAFDANVNAKAGFESVVRATLDAAIQTGSTNLLGEPIRHVYGTLVGLVPVWIETEITFEAGFNLEAQVHGAITNRLYASKSFTWGKRYRPEENPPWSTPYDNPLPVFAIDSPQWQLEGSGNLRVFVRPQVTVYLQSLIGVQGYVEPYVGLTNNFQFNPPSFNLTLYGGMEGYVGLDIRGWDEDRWGPLLKTEPFDIIPRTELKTWMLSPPRIIAQPSDQNLKAGETAVLTVNASGTIPLTYQWQHNGRNLSDTGRVYGSQSAQLSIRDVQETDNGEYAVRVSNGVGTVTSPTSRLVVQGSEPEVPPSGMALIPAGSFRMGDTFNESGSDELPVHSVSVSAFYIDRYEVTKARWDEVYSWAGSHGYTFAHGASAKAASHPVHSLSWYDAVRWCNARSEKEGRPPAYFTDAELTQPYRAGNLAPHVSWRKGYRLPTEAEWEKAARGGLSGMRFPWGNRITHNDANYNSNSSYSYDASPTKGWHPTYANGSRPYTSPVGVFTANGYGVHDMAGNVWEWCWDWQGNSYYASSPVGDPRGPSTGTLRVRRGGGWNYDAFRCRIATRYSGGNPAEWSDDIGFRCALPAD
ncbi:MAG: SUMF1/EgtB/PvdO family nonheme iron enzyme [Verrucomicrobiia bacterium]